MASVKIDLVHSRLVNVWLDCRAMSMSYYTSFLVEDPECEDFRHICGVLELRKPLGCSAAEGDLQAILAKGMNVSREAIQVVCWSPLH